MANCKNCKHYHECYTYPNTIVACVDDALKFIVDKLTATQLRDKCVNNEKEDFEAFES